MARRALVTSLVVNVVAIFVDVLIVAGVAVSGWVVLAIGLLPPTVYIIAVRLMATERRNAATLRGLVSGILGVNSK
jgi:hypothetical protein